MNLKLIQERLADYKSECRTLSKQIIPYMALFMVLSSIITVWLAGTVASAPLSQGSGAPARATRNAAIVAATEDILKETSELRELSILRPVKSGAQSRAEIERMIVRNLNEQTTPTEMHATEVALKKFGLAPPDFKYQLFIVKLLTEQVAGYYDPKAQHFYLADWIELEGQKPVMAHELTHALQDQHFNLRRFEDWPPGESDAELAAHALIEGDATLAMNFYMAKNPLVALAFVRSLGSTNLSSALFRQAPRALRESLVFPYEQGAEWVTRIHKEGVWKMVSDAYMRLPESTEQILHPEKYLVSEAPQKVVLRDIHHLIGAGWKRIDYDVNGEWSFYMILDQFLNSPSESQRAAMGWAGDRYALYEGARFGEVLVSAMTAWDTEEDAREFLEAYARRTTRRYTGSRMIKNLSPFQNLQTSQDKGNLVAWETTEGLVVIEKRGLRVLVLEGIPAKTDSKAIIRACWQ